jgi:hypothetical protein
MILLGSAASLIGGVAHIPVKADAAAKINVTIEASLKTAGKPNAVTGKFASSSTKKGKRTMKTIGKGSKYVWWKASALRGG